MDSHAAQPDSPLVGQGVAPILPSGRRRDCVENARGIPIAGVAPPAVLQGVLDGLGVMALEGDTKGRQNPCPELRSLDTRPSEPETTPGPCCPGESGAFVTAHTAKPGLPVTQRARTAEQRLNGGLELHPILPQHTIGLHILAQARNHRPQLDASLGQQDPWTQHQPQRNPAAARRHNRALAGHLAFGDRWCRCLANRSRCAALDPDASHRRRDAWVSSAASTANDTTSLCRNKRHRPTRPPTNMPTTTNPGCRSEMRRQRPQAQAWNARWICQGAVGGRDRSDSQQQVMARQMTCHFMVPSPAINWGEIATEWRRCQIELLPGPTTRVSNYARPDVKSGLIFSTATPSSTRCDSCPPSKPIIET